MASYLRLEGVDMWHLAGWTMVHFLWLGALVGIAAAGCRLVLRRATPNARYIAAMVSLAVLAAMPLGIAAWIMQHPRTNLRLESSIAARDTATRGDLVNNEANERFSNNMALRSQTAPAAPGSAGGLIEGDERFASLSARPSRGLPGELLAWPLASIVNWLESCIVYLPWIWFLGTPLTLVLLATGIVGTKRLRLASQPVAAGPLTEMSSRLAKSLRVGQRVMIATCDRVCAPVLVGILRPMILLPPAALTGWSPDEIEMVLLHELAHVRRWDNLVNLLQRLVESLLFFHPVVWMVSTWMRRDRESCCDAIVVTCTRRPHAYAELLVALAAQMPRSVLFHPAASSAMAAGPLRNRIRRILQLEDDAMLISGKSFAVVLAGLLSAATLVVLYLPTRGQAEESAAEVTEYTEQSEENAESADVAEEASENETKVDAPTDQAASDAEDDWLRAAEFASRKEHEIAQRAWEELGIKAVPLSEAELEGVRRGGFRGGLKLIGLEDVMNTQGPLILTHIQSKSLATGIGDFASLERALDALASQPPDELLVLQGIKPRGGIFQYSMRRPQEKSAQSTIADAPNADGQAKPESVDAAVDNGPSRRVEVEQLRVGDEDVIVFRGARDNVDTFVKKLKDGENREPQKERRVLGTFTSDNDGLEKLVRAVDEARGKNLYVDIITKGTEWSLVVVPEPTEAEWPAMLGDPPRKERVIADKAWERLGLKVVPASELESFEFLSRGLPGGPVKILGGNVPKGLPLPAFLRRVGGNSLDTFDDLHAWLLNEEDERPTPVKVYAFANGHEYLFDAGPIDVEEGPPSQGPKLKFPSLEDQKLADLAWQMLQLELEPARRDELKHVRALGYQGGVTVTGTARSDGRRVSYNEIQPGDILVGLHVWPTTSLKDVANILTRDDLPDLNPLKFYVVRAEELVITGRISVRSRESQPTGMGSRSQSQPAERGEVKPPAFTADPRAASEPSGSNLVASESEIKVLQDHIKTLQSQFDRIDALFKAGRRGGNASTRALSAYELAVAKGELALMQGQRAQAVKSFHEAQSQAEDAFKAMSADYEVGNTTYDVVLLTSKNLAEIKRRIIQLEQQRTAPNRAAAAGAGPATSFAAPEAGGAENPPATSAAPKPNLSSSPNKRRDAGATVSAESQEALDEFMQLASSPQPNESISVLKKILGREKQKYDRMVELAENGRVSTAEVETQKANYEISMERLRQAERALQYHRALVAMAVAEYEAALEASKKAPGAVSESELRKLQLKVQAAEAMYKTLAE